MINRKKILVYLIVITALLLFLNIFIDVFNKSSEKENSHELSRSEIENTVWKVLDDYGIKANWVSKKKLKIANEDSVNAQYFISIPEDIPIPLLIRDVNNVIENDVTAFVSEEKQIFGATEIRIYSNEILKLKATIIPNPNLVRDKNSFSFIISDGIKLNDKQYFDFLHTNYPLACAIVPDAKLISKVDSLVKYSKEYILLLNDDLSDSRMKLLQEYQKELLRSSLKRIFTAFPQPQFVLIDEKSQLFNSPIYNFVRDEILGRKISVRPLSELIKLDLSEESELISKFNFYAQDTTSSKQKLFFLPMENFEKILPLIAKYKKQGSRIIAVSKVLM